MFCKYCENVTNDTDVYCSKCGKAQIEKNETVASEKTTKIEKIARVINVLSVSYTHLDVYKRQISRRSMSVPSSS